MTNTDLNQLHDLLNIYNDFKHELLNKKSQGINDYNLITSLLKKHDEVRVHSRFLKSMLNPNGLHYQDDAFLTIFLNEFVPKKYHPNAKNCHVYDEKDNIDLLIEDGEKYIIIENKIYAQDQPYQITRYIDKTLEKGAEPKNITVIYLSLDGKNPTWKEDGASCYGFEIENNQLIWQGDKNNDDLKKHVSIDRLNKLTKENSIPLITLSYHHDIPQWVDKCLIELISSHYPKKQNTENIQFAFVQYQSVLNMLNPNRKWKKMSKFIDKILEEEKEKNIDYCDLFTDIYHNFLDCGLNKLLDLVFDSFDEIYIDNKEITKDDLRLKYNNWFHEKGLKDDWKNVIITGKLKNGENAVFALGAAYAYLSTDVNKIWDSENKINHYVRYNFNEFIKELEQKLK